MKKGMLFAGVSALMLSGCYHAVIDTGRAPNGTTIQRPWAHGFVAGLVPPSVTETAKQCPSGVAKVETKHSFLNMLAASLTWGLYTPMTITVTCAGNAADAGIPTVKAEAGKPSDAVQQAVELSQEKASAVLVQF